MMSAQRSYAGLSYDEVLHKYADTVAGVCVARLQNQADAEDCFQNTFIKLFQKSPDFRDENHLKAWLIRVAINECRDYVDKNRRVISLDAIEREHIISLDDERDASWALMRTRPKYREVLYLYYCQRYKVDEIARILGKKPNTVKTLLKRGREELRRIYGGDANE